jgi:hypothetical protein
MAIPRMRNRSPGSDKKVLTDVHFRTAESTAQPIARTLQRVSPISRLIGLASECLAERWRRRLTFHGRAETSSGLDDAVLTCQP